MNSQRSKVSTSKRGSAPLGPILAVFYLILVVASCLFLPAILLADYFTTSERLVAHTGILAAAVFVLLMSILFGVASYRRRKAIRKRRIARSASAKNSVLVTTAEVLKVDTASSIPNFVKNFPVPKDVEPARLDQKLDVAKDIVVDTDHLIEDVVNKVVKPPKIHSQFCEIPEETSSTPANRELFEPFIPGIFAEFVGEEEQKQHLVTPVEELNFEMVEPDHAQEKEFGYYSAKIEDVTLPDKPRLALITSQEEEVSSDVDSIISQEISKQMNAIPAYIENNIRRIVEEEVAKAVSREISKIIVESLQAVIPTIFNAKAKEQLEHA